MTDRSPLPGKFRPDTLFLRTEDACDLDPEHLLKVFSEQRRRFVAVLRGFGPDDWAAPTRCADWSAQDVVRHLCDGDAIGIAAGAGDRTLDVTAGFDPRITPRRWLAASAGESPDATLGRFAATTGELLGTGRYRLAQGVRFNVCLPYGPMDWTVRLLHRFWDSWLHERDVLLARGAEHPTDGDATAYATAYGVFLAAAVASMFADPVQEKLTLGGDGGGIFEVDSRSGVTLSVNRGNTAGRLQPRSRTRSPAAHRSPPCSAICRPARVPPYRTWPTSSTRQSRRHPETPEVKAEASPTPCRRLMCSSCRTPRLCLDPFLTDQACHIGPVLRD